MFCLLGIVFRWMHRAAPTCTAERPHVRDTRRTKPPLVSSWDPSSVHSLKLAWPSHFNSSPNERFYIFEDTGNLGQNILLPLVSFISWDTSPLQPTGASPDRGHNMQAAEPMFLSLLPSNSYNARLGDRARFAANGHFPLRSRTLHFRIRPVVSKDSWGQILTPSCVEYGWLGWRQVRCPDHPLRERPSKYGAFLEPEPCHSLLAGRLSTGWHACCPFLQ